MPRDLFGDVTDPSIKVGSRKWYTVPVSLALHTIAVLTAVIVPLMATGALPVPYNEVVFVPVMHLRRSRHRLRCIGRTCRNLR